MSEVEAYLAELRAALGDRLPPSVHEARLREVRAHLRESSADLGEAEAARRYGRPRAVANGLVRSHRGYGERSAWSLSPAVAVPLCAAVLVPTLAIQFGMLGTAVPLALAACRALLALTAAGFLLRAIQTRRWLVAPMVAAHAAAVVLAVVVGLLQRPPAVWTWHETVLFFRDLAILAAIWAALNALALGLGRLLDLQGVRPARRAR